MLALLGQISHRTEIVSRQVIVRAYTIRFDAQQQ